MAQWLLCQEQELQDATALNEVAEGDAWLALSDLPASPQDHREAELKAVWEEVALAKLACSLNAVSFSAFSSQF